MSLPSKSVRRRPWPRLLPMLLLSLAACSKPVAPPPDTVATETRSDPLEVAVDPAVNTGIRVEALKTAAVSDTLRVAGRIDFNETRLARIGSTVTGRVVDVKVLPGQKVQAGDTLAMLNSTELSTAQLAYLKARSQAKLLDAGAERARALFESDVISRAELQRRENEAEVARTEERGLGDQLRVLGMSVTAVQELADSGVIDSVRPVVARIGGTVIERSVTPGQVVQPADTLFTVADLSRLWVVADVPEQQASFVREGQDVEIEVPSSTHALRGRIIYVSAVVDPKTRTVLARCDIDNAGGELRPEMLANLLIRTAPSERLVVPAASVVREDNRDHVYVQTGANRYRLTPVTLGAAIEGEWRPVLDGLTAGQAIVVEGAFHLNNERRRQELE